MGVCISRCCVRLLAGAFRDFNETYREGLSPEALSFVEDAFQGLDPSKILDCHIHLLGQETEKTGCYLHPNLSNCCHCISYAKKQIFMQAATGSDDPTNLPDEEYVYRLVGLLENFIPPIVLNSLPSDVPKPSTKALLLGLDWVYSPQGEKQPENTSVFTPNTYVEEVSRQYPSLFQLTPGIHPYRPDAIEILDQYFRKGARVVKWLPNSQGIDPASPQCDEFYAAMAERKMTLLTHTGQEKSLDDAGFTNQNWGNPLRLRRALNAGVRVIMAHCASEGTDIDLDHPGPVQPRLESFDLCMRLLDDPRYAELAYADISATTLIRRCHVLERIIVRRELHSRLIYGSDYPVPCVNAIIWFGKLVSKGLLTREQADLLREVYEYNPLLCDFVAKRCMRFVDASNVEHRFQDIIFQQRPLVEEGIPEI